MSSEYINLTLENLNEEHLCCAISDKKHQNGVAGKREWLKDRIPEGHVFRKLDAKGKVFIEYAPLEKAWVPVEGDNYLYIYCLWVSGSYKGKNHGKDLLKYCMEDAEKQGRSGICVLSSKKKKPYLSDPKFFEKFGFKPVDQVGEYELLALSLNGDIKCNTPGFTDTARAGEIDSNNLTIYYSTQCPFTDNCIEQISRYCENGKIKIDFIKVDSLKKAKELPSIFNNWAIFNEGKFLTNHLLNESYFRKMILKEK